MAKSPTIRHEIRQSRLAGTWYPDGTDRLRREVDDLLDAVGPQGEEPLAALIVPHAGYRYSGRAAAAGYKRIRRGRWKRAAILAPSHYHSFEGAAVFPGQGFETPLGVVRVDREACDAIVTKPGFSLDASPYAREHSLEIQLPFLQRVDPAIRLVPILVGVGIGELSEGLRALDDGDTLLVVSSDFTHYGASFDYLPFPPSGAKEVGDSLRALDLGAIELVCRLDADGFERYLHDTDITICGRAPILAFLRAQTGGLAGTVVSYYTSLDVTGDFEHSVSYATILFTPASRAE